MIAAVQPFLAEKSAHIMEKTRPRLWGQTQTIMLHNSVDPRHCVSPMEYRRYVIDLMLGYFQMSYPLVQWPRQDVADIIRDELLVQVKEMRQVGKLLEAHGLSLSEALANEPRIMWIFPPSFRRCLYASRRVVTVTVMSKGRLWRLIYEIISCLYPYRLHHVTDRTYGMHLIINSSYI